MKILALILASFLVGCAGAHAVEIQNNALVIDGQSQPQQFGAEVQYFRLRGGYGRNVPKEKVIALWNKALDRLVEAHMNTVSFYIPWDFHEYAEGKFDFTGSVDEDGDGNPDYPSRDVITFLRLVKEHGIQHVMVRPGPFINAEWGFLGFGAVPQWFHDKYPASHMRAPWGWNRALYDYLDPDLLAHTKLWFKALYDQVLKDNIGPGKPVAFLQLDNETNYQWMSIYNGDYAPRTVERYRDFLRERYRDLGSVNRAHSRFWRSWEDVLPPAAPGVNLGEDQDWYRYSDQVIYQFLRTLRGYWEEIGAKEPDVMFTLAESYNVTSPQGMLPNFRYRNARGATGLQTVNLYPKTAPGDFLFNSPFKADIDVKSAGEANAGYHGSRQEWVLGPEVQGGWWRGITVTPAARLQTYLTVLGHGMKAMFVYYFNEGQNFGTEWGIERTKPLFDALRKERNVESVPISELPNDFWGELQARSDRLNLIGIDTRRLMTINPTDLQTLYFDAPLDANAEPREHFYQLKEIGEKVVAPHQDFLARATEANDDVSFVRDSEATAPSPVPGISSALLESDGAGGVLGYLMSAGVNPRVLIGDISAPADFHQPKVLVHLDSGVNAAQTIQSVREASAAGVHVLNFLAEDLPCRLGVTGMRLSCVLPATATGGESAMAAGLLEFYVGENGQLLSAPDSRSVKVHLKAPYSFPVYDLAGSENCEGILFWQGKPAAYRCRTASGGSVVQVGPALYQDYNTDAYGRMSDAESRRLFLHGILAGFGVQPKVQATGDRVVAFARQDPQHEGLWVTVKTGARTAQSPRLIVNGAFLAEALGTSPQVKVQDLLAGTEALVSTTDLTSAGYAFSLDGDGSKVFFLSIPKP